MVSFGLKNAPLHFFEGNESSIFQPVGLGDFDLFDQYILVYSEDAATHFQLLRNVLIDYSSSSSISI